MTENERLDREKARLKYKPDKIKWLLIAEAPPSEPDRYFYFDYVIDKDILFVEIMKVLCQNDNLDVQYLRQCKPLLLRQFQKEGFFLIDAEEEPFPEGKKGRARERIIKKNSANVIERVKALVNEETKIILIKAPVFELRNPLIKNGFNVLNDEQVEFPLYQHREKFKEKMNLLLKPFFDDREERKRENILVVPDEKQKSEASNCIVVDGSNIAYDGIDDGPSVENIILTYEQLIDRYQCPEVFVVIGPGQMYKIRNNDEKYGKLMAFFSDGKRKYLVDAPGGHYDDEFVIQLAFDVDFNILSNDRYRDIMEQNPQIADKLKSKLLKYKIVNGKLIVPGLGEFVKK